METMINGDELVPLPEKEIPRYESWAFLIAVSLQVSGLIVVGQGLVLEELNILIASFLLQQY
jgi:hypothetical protein